MLPQIMRTLNECVVNFLIKWIKPEKIACKEVAETALVYRSITMDEIWQILISTSHSLLPSKHPKVQLLINGLIGRGLDVSCTANEALYHKSYFQKKLFAEVINMSASVLNNIINTAITRATTVAITTITTLLLQSLLVEFSSLSTLLWSSILAPLLTSSTSGQCLKYCQENFIITMNVTFK